MSQARRHRVLIIGCGQLGSRHLQAVASMPTVAEIEVVDPRPEAWQLGQQRLGELPALSHSPVVRWLSSIDQATKDGDLCIIATQAKERCTALRNVAENLGYKSFILEKIVAQSVKEMEDAVALATSLDLQVWVNCQTRAVPFFQSMKQRLDPADPVICNIVGGMQFLATQGIHDADLFVFYDECLWITASGSQVDPVLYPSKRGEDLFDLRGTLIGYTAKGSSLTISHLDSDYAFGHVSIATRQYRCFVDYLQGWAVESDQESDWAWQQVPYEDNLLVSQTTTKFASSILTSGQCPLPTLEESLVSHRFVLGELQPHFSKLLGRPMDHCPVT